MSPWPLEVMAPTAMTSYWQCEGIRNRAMLSQFLRLQETIDLASDLKEFPGGSATIDFATLHDKQDVLDRHNVVEGIARDRDDIGIIARL
jgi:hypothetical protein